MKAVILAGGLGTRLSEETVLKPKPMVEIGGRPILWHIMKIYSHHGIHEFVICLGYRGYLIKEYFANYNLHMSDVTFDLANNRLEVHHNSAEPWRVTLVETGELTHTAGRLKRIAPYVKDGPFCMTYGDGVSDVDIGQLVDYHRNNGKLATVTAVQPTGRFGALQLAAGGLVDRFEEKPRGDHGWINGGFFVLDPKALEYCGDDPNTPWERLPMEQLARDRQLVAYQHEGFWHAMDTLRDKNHLEELWSGGSAPWKRW
jgi:glucose-1-phosphate cytidylyltransferase